MEDSANASSENAPPTLGEGAPEGRERALSRPAATLSQGERGIKPPPSLLLTRRFYLSGLALVYAIAFLSLWVQVHGLVGSRGILPAEDFVKIATERLGSERFYILPTLSWFIGAGDGALHFLCAAGFLSSLALLAGFAPVITGTLCWVFYLSLYTVCREFLSFQWDILLLETGFLSLFLAPLRAISPWSPAWQEPPRFLPVLALRVLLFKLMFFSGVVKLSGGDPTWRDLSALAYHYETTCLPGWTSWYAHQLPLWFHELSAVGMYGIELVVPFFVFGPRLFRLIAAAAFFLLMAFIGATGNYGFFNLQSVMLCVILLDDAVLPKWLNLGPSSRHFYFKRAEGTPPPILGEGPGERAGFGDNGSSKPSWPFPLVAPIVGLILLLNLVPLVSAFRSSIRPPGFLLTLYEWQSPFHLVNGYGLFANMTTERPEIIVEGSEDGKNWKAYEFKWKPGDLQRRPGFIQPHMPRLDWVMWFAALGNPRHDRWFIAFSQKLLQGSPEVLALLEKNPFPEKPPKLLRSTLYDYNFTTFEERGKNGAWWKRTEIGPYTPILYIPPDNPEGLAVWEGE